MRRVIAAGLLAAALVVVPAMAASAHPLGNFTINQYSGLHVSTGAVTVDLVTDMAEIPTFQIRGDIDTNHDGHVDAAEANRWRAAECRAQAAKLSLQVDSRPVRINVGDHGSLTFPPGQAGLDTLRLECTLSAELSGPTARPGPHTLAYRNTSFDGRLGWREITAVGDAGVRVTGDVPTTSVSNRLTRYPADLLRSPLALRTAALRIDVAAGSGPARATSTPSTTGPSPAGPTSILPRGVDRATRAFTSLVSRQRLTVAFGLLAVALAVLLGAIHALAPGHGKTVMAAYLVAQRGSLRQAAIIALTVTATHTTGVLALGIVLTTSSVIAPERLYPWLGLASGLLLASIGVSLLVRARRGRRLLVNAVSADAASLTTTALPVLPEPVDERVLVAVGAARADQIDGRHDDSHVDFRVHHGPQNHLHDHPEVHVYHHHGRRAHIHAPVDASRPIGWRSLVAMGFAGGLVPSPSALVVLLGAIALGRAWFGLVLVVAYGIGMAATLTGAGLLLVRARGFIDRRARRGPGRLVTLTGLLPAATATLIVVLGLVLAARGAAKI